MSPILVRPVREQFEHDRVIRVLQARYKRKYEVVINPGAEQNASVDVGELALYPDLVLFSQERSRKMQGTVEVETVESINTLEAMAQWGPFSRLRAAFFLYVPANTIDTVRRLCVEYSISPAEIWTYHVAIDQVRFTMVQRSPDAPRIPESRAEKSAADAKVAVNSEAEGRGNKAKESRNGKDRNDVSHGNDATEAKALKTSKTRKGDATVDAGAAAKSANAAGTRDRAVVRGDKPAKKPAVKKPVAAKTKAKAARPAPAAAKKAAKKASKPVAKKRR